MPPQLWDVDACLARLPQLLANRGLTLEQRVGYKAGKLPSGRNWCQLVDGDVPLRVSFPNREGKMKTWKLFARFAQALGSPWDRPEPYERKKAQWMPAGDDVWGIAYEDLMVWASQVTCDVALQRLVNDLLASFHYSCVRYK